MIIDAYELTSKSLLRYLHKVFNIGYAENSTYSLIKEKLLSQDLFIVNVVGEGVSKIAQLKKKSE
ncbi:hypothetical protein D3C74_349910 [compost metagenome]